MTVSADSTLQVYPTSIAEQGGTTYFMARTRTGRVLGVQGAVEGFEGYPDEATGSLLCPLTPENLERLRTRILWLRPQTLGIRKSIGCGDRLGLATPQHLRAIQAGGEILPIPAQQSMRENERTGRTPRQVLNDAAWGVFESGWRGPWGADADHLKSLEHIDLCAESGYTFYTLDPGDYVDNGADSASPQTLQANLKDLPWEALDDSVDSLQSRYGGTSVQIESFAISFDEEALFRASCKYGHALAHTARMYHHLAEAMKGTSFEVEISLDEAEAPTSPLEHYFLARELQRLGVEWVSLAPRYVGRLEKGVDYIGDLETFEAAFQQHAAIARSLGPYKLSLHSGSDKFSLYPLIAKHAGRLVHIKTSGTSYLEALRVVARVAPSLFRGMLQVALRQYADDGTSYHVSADPANLPPPDSVPDSQLPSILDQFDGRQVLHVTFGSVLAHHGRELIDVLAAHEEEHYDALQAHFQRHLAPFR